MLAKLHEKGGSVKSAGDKVEFTSEIYVSPPDNLTEPFRAT